MTFPLPCWFYTIFDAISIFMWIEKWHPNDFKSRCNFFIFTLKELPFSYYIRQVRKPYHIYPQKYIYFCTMVQNWNICGTVWYAYLVSSFSGSKIIGVYLYIMVRYWCYFIYMRNVFYINMNFVVFQIVIHSGLFVSDIVFSSIYLPY